jgi:hypothetical protein
MSKDQAPIGNTQEENEALQFYEYMRGGHDK